MVKKIFPKNSNTEIKMSVQNMTATNTAPPNRIGRAWESYDANLAPVVLDFSKVLVRNQLPGDFWCHYRKWNLFIARIFLNCPTGYAGPPPSFCAGAQKRRGISRVGGAIKFLNCPVPLSRSTPSFCAGAQKRRGISDNK